MQAKTLYAEFGKKYKIPTPRKRSGSVFEARWLYPECSNGAVIIPIRPCNLFGSSPKWVRLMKKPFPGSDNP